MHDHMRYKTNWTIRKYADEAAWEADAPYEVTEIEGNLLLNEGIQDAWDLICGLGSPTAFNAANAYIGVGDSSAAEAATQTGLQAASNKAYVAMKSGYPQRTNQTMRFAADFAGGVANFAWNELTVANGNSDAAKNLNRKVSAQGTKAAGQVWTVNLDITLS